MKKRKIFKKITLAGLAACMFCLPILAGCAPAEMLPQNPEPGQNFDLGLNPETDPVVYTTASGLQIKKSNAAISNTATVTTNIGYTYTQDLRHFYYFTMGAFSGTIYTGETLTSTYTVTNEPVNWLIIGRGPGFNFESATPAGSAIQGEVGKQEIAFSNSMYECMDLSSIPEHSDIPKGCFLVLSEKLLGQMYFNSSGSGNYTLWTTNVISNQLGGNGWYGNRYRFYADKSTFDMQSWTIPNNKGGDLYNYINNLFSKNNSTGAIESGNKLGFTQSQANLIVPQQLYTHYTDGSGAKYVETPETDKGTYYTMFPLAWKSESPDLYQNFCLEDYLPSLNQRIAIFIGSKNQAYYWWTRSGSYISHSHCAPYIFPNGSHYAGASVSGYFGVRPAMVMKLS